MKPKTPIYRKPFFWITVLIVAVIAVVLPRLVTSAPVGNPTVGTPVASPTIEATVVGEVECLPVSEAGIVMLRSEGDPTRGERARIVSGFTTPVEGEVFDHLALLKLDDGVTFFMAASGDLSAEDPFVMLYPANPAAEPYWFSESNDPMDWTSTGGVEGQKLVELYGEELASCGS